MFVQSQDLPHFELVRAITHHPFKLEPPNLVLSCKIPWEFMELHMLNSTYFQNPVYIYHFFIFEIFVRLAKTDENGVCTLICSSTASCHGPWISWVVSLVLTIAGFPVLDSTNGIGFFLTSVGFRQIIQMSRGEFCMPTFSNGRNNSKTACICLWCVLFAKFTLALFLPQTWGKTS